MSYTEQTGGMTTGKEATLHQRILSDIEGQIVSGAWPPGHRIPFEMDMYVDFDTDNLKVKARERYVPSYTDWRAVYGSFPSS